MTNCVKHYLCWWLHKVTISWRRKGTIKIFAMHDTFWSTWKYDKLCWSLLSFQSYQTIKYLPSSVKNLNEDETGDESSLRVQISLLMANFLLRSWLYFFLIRPKWETTLIHQTCYCNFERQRGMESEMGSGAQSCTSEISSALCNYWVQIASAEGGPCSVWS